MSERDLALGVVGTLVIDTIFAFDAEPRPVESLGGIAYSLHTLAALAPHPSFVVPALRLGADAAPFLRSELAGLGVDGRFLQTSPAPQNRVELRYTAPEQRHEILRGGVPAVGRAELEPLLDEVNAFYVNFVAGNELTLPTLRWLRRAFAKPIYVDLHSLLLGRARSGLRYFRPVPRWREWVACCDVLQCNAEEAAFLWSGAGGEAGRRRGRPGRPQKRREARTPGRRDPVRTDPVRRPAPIAEEDAELLADHVLGLGPTQFILTSGPGPVRLWRAGRGARTGGGAAMSRGARGGVARTGSARTGVARTYRPRPPGAVRDPTGCGDVLGAAFCALHLMRGLPAERALADAVAAAAWKTTRSGTAGLAAALSTWYLEHEDAARRRRRR